MVDANSRSPADRPQEYPAVRTTIVGGRPPGCGKALGPIPRGIEVLVKKAAVDPEFKLTLMQQRAAAADAIGLVLEPAEETMLNMIPAPQLAAIIARTTVDPRVKPAFLGRAAAVMLVALGASAIQLTSAQDAAQRGARPLQTLPIPPATTTSSSAPTAQDRKPRTPMDVGGMMADLPATSFASEPSTAPAPVVEPMPGPSAGVRALPPQPRSPMMESAGVRADLPRPVAIGTSGGMRSDIPETPPETAPASQQATTTQASQPTTFPAVTRDQIMPILKQLDSAAYKNREEAQKKLQGLGQGALEPLREILKTHTLSAEVVARIKAAMWTLKTTTRPALLNPPARPEQVVERIGMRADTPLPAGPTENPED